MSEVKLRRIGRTHERAKQVSLVISYGVQMRLMLALAVLATVPQFVFASNLRIASWNMANLPNDAEDEAYLSTIVKAMGSELVLGEARPVDILSLSETDVESASRTASVFNSVYDTSSYNVIVSSPDGGGDRTGFVYDSSVIALLSRTELSTGLTHNILRGDFRFGEEYDFHFYSIHLKSGELRSERDLRYEESKTIRADADSLGADAHVLYGGDFNWQRSDDRGEDDSAWDVFTQSGNGQGFDTYDLSNVSGAGDWRNNEDFRLLHSQDPRAQMDDRFDLHFVTDDFFDRGELELVQGSYRVFGNDGTHQLDGRITSGQGASDEVLRALARFSDHLPVVSDFNVVLVGDIDGDGEVGFADFVTLSNNYGLTPATFDDGDIDGDGQVAFSDFVLLSSNYGKKLPSLASVPEPTGLFTAVMSLTLLRLWNRTRGGVLTDCKSCKSSEQQV